MIRSALLSITGATLVAASAAHAGIGGNWGAEFRLVDNSDAVPSADPAGAAAWAPFTGRWQTYDLILTGEANAELNGINFGEASNPGANPFYLFTDADAIFNHPLGGDRRNEALEGFFNLLRFDTFVAIGDLEAPGELGTVDLNLSPTRETINGVEGFAIRGAWFEIPPAGAALDANGEARILRITLAWDDAQNIGFLGGNGSMVQIGTDSGLINIPIPVPAPGAAGVLALAGLCAARRRRA